MSAQTSYCLVVVGSGPGIGSHVASLFAAKRYRKIALISRNNERLQKEKLIVEQAALPNPVIVRTYSVDITHTDKLQNALSQISTDFGTPECVYFNAAIVRPSQLLQTSEEEVITDFKVQTPRLSQNHVLTSFLDNCDWSSQCR